MKTCQNFETKYFLSSQIPSFEDLWYFIRLRTSNPSVKPIEKGLYLSSRCVSTVRFFLPLNVRPTD